MLAMLFNRRWYQFSLLSMMLLTLASAYIAHGLTERARERAALIDRITGQGGKVIYSGDNSNPDALSRNVVGVVIPDTGADRITLQQLHIFPQISTVTLRNTSIKTDAGNVLTSELTLGPVTSDWLSKCEVCR